MLQVNAQLSCLPIEKKVHLRSLETQLIVRGYLL